MCIRDRRERIKRQEKAIETVIAERDLINERCDKQRALIEQLQWKLQHQSEASPAERQEDDFDIADVTLDLGSSSDTGNRGGNFGRQIPGEAKTKVSSMRAALFRIRGIETTNSEEHKNGYDEFDASEFRPIVDRQGVLANLRHMLANLSVVRIATMGRGKRNQPAL